MSFKLSSLNIDTSEVHMKDEAHVENVINLLIQGSVQQLQVVSDFDMTLTRAHKNGEHCGSSYEALDNSKLLPSSYGERAVALKKHYYPIEIDPSLTVQQKIPYMLQWWDKVHQLMLDVAIREDMLPRIAEQSNAAFRDGTDWLLDNLYKHKVPLLVFSAGVGNVIEQIFKVKAKWYDNMKIVSNFMTFNSQGVINGFEDGVMHVFNKNEHAIHKSGYFEKLSQRHNIILMGDSIGDLHMTEGAKYHNILKIGFLNHNKEQLLEKYKEGYDMVLWDDQTFNVTNAILKCIMN